MQKLLSLLVILSLTILSHPAFVQSKGKEVDNGYPPRQTIESAIKRAQEHAAKQGIDLKDYSIVSVEYKGEGGKWWVWFMGRRSIPGHHFTVTVDDRNDGMQLFRGR